jgi:hypothetical protein
MKKYCEDNVYSEYGSMYYLHSPQRDPPDDVTIVYNYFLKPSTDNSNLAKVTDRKFYCRNSNYNLIKDTGFTDGLAAYFINAPSR